MKKQLEELKNKIFGTGELYDKLENIIEEVERESLKLGNNSIYEIYYDIEDNSFRICEFSINGEDVISLNGLIWLVSIDNSYNDHFFADERAFCEDIDGITLSDEQIIDKDINEIVSFDMDDVEANLNSQIQECD